LQEKKHIEHQQIPVAKAGVQQPIMARQVSNSKLKNNKRPVVVVKNSNADDFIRRKEEFLKNQARGKGFLNNPLVARPPSAAIVKKDEKFLYEEKLKEIRLKNFNNRKVIYRNQNQDESYNRMKHIAALRVRLSN
jgi:hypothetical protein